MAVVYSEFRIKATIVAKELDINMSFCTEESIEVIEKDKEKLFKFVQRIKKLNKRTRIVDLIASNQYTDTKGNDIRNSKALYLIDDDYYKQIVEVRGELDLGQVSMF